MEIVHFIQVHSSSFIYKMANEDVSIYKDYLKNSKRILSVISSGDQIIESITSEKKIIDCFDISKYPKYYLMLKLTALKALKKEDYVKLFIESPLTTLDEYYDDLYYENIRKPNDFIYKSLSYLKDENYYKLRKNIENAELNFYEGDIFTLVSSLTSKYDLVYLSNIIDYANKKDYKNLLSKFNLNDNGVVLSYIFSHVKKYSDFLAEYKIEELIRKYSDYIRYPIKMEVEHEHEVEQPEGEKKEPKFEKVRHDEILNSMIPIWKKNKSEVSDEDYNNFYQEKFGDYQKPLKVIRTSVEGDVSYTALLYIPSHTPYDYYTKDFKRGLQLYSNGVLIMDKCEDLLPDCYGFVRGLVDSPDLSLNISREMLQHDRQLKIIAKNLDKKIKSELLDMLHKNREDYEKFFTTFGTTLKFGVYNDFGLNKDNLKDLLMFHSSTENKLVTLDEYVDRIKEGQDKIYYACGETVDKIELLPQVEAVKEKGYEILYLTENIDEFVVQVLMEHKEKKFINVCANDVDLDTDEEKEALKKENEENKGMFTLMKETIGEGVQEVRFTHRLKNHPVCLTSEGALSVEMEKVINSMPNDQKVKAQTALEINDSHPIAQKIKDLYENDKEELKKYTQVLYAQARLIEGLPVENPTQISNLICEIIAK